jgi:hypothetical protein
MPDQDIPENPRVQITIKGMPAKTKLIVEHVNGVILRDKPVYAFNKKVPKKKVDSKFQPSKKPDIPETSKKRSLIQDSAPIGNPFHSEEKKYQEPLCDETERKARIGSGKPAEYYDDEGSSPREELLGVTNSANSFAEAVRRRA